MSAPKRTNGPLLGPAGCRVLGAAFIACALFELATSQIVPQGGEITQAVCQLLPAGAIVAAITAMGTPRLSWAYRALWASAAALTAWFIVAYVASTGK
jgi:hypothetical protein